MKTKITFNEYDDMYKQIINAIILSDEVGVTTLEEPLLLEERFFEGNFLIINEEYYQKHKEDIKKLIIDTINSTREKEFGIVDLELIDPDIIKSLINSKHIKCVRLLPNKGLNKEEIDILLKNQTKDISCTVDFDAVPNLLYKNFGNIEVCNYPLICSNSVSNFTGGKVNLVVDKELSEEEVARLGNLFENYPQETINIEFNYKGQMLGILDKVKSKEIVIKNTESWTNKEYELLEENYDNIMIEIDTTAIDPSVVSLSTIIEKNKIIDLIINDVKSLELSPLEQYMYLYNVVKMYKEYKEEPADIDNMAISRDVIFVLFNDYIVCTGYTLFLEELIGKLQNPGIGFTHYSCGIEQEGEIFYHRKGLVRIKDDKYGVDGLYISDPTWDSISYYKTIKKEDGTIEYDYNSPISHYDLYNHFLLTKEETIDEKMEYIDSDITDILFSNSSSSDLPYVKRELYPLADLAIKKLFGNKHMTREMIDSKIANIKQSPITAETLVTAISNLYSKMYYATEEEISKFVTETVNINHSVQSENFNLTSNKFVNYQKK